jgi:hypothetical protein
VARLRPALAGQIVQPLADSRASASGARRTVFGATASSLQARPCESPCAAIRRRAAGALSFCQQVLQRGDVEHRLRQQLLQAPVLALEALQALRVRRAHPPKLRFPAIEGLLADPVSAADLGRRRLALLLAQHADDLRLAEPALPHGPSSDDGLSGQSESQLRGDWADGAIAASPNRLSRDGVWCNIRQRPKSHTRH